MGFCLVGFFKADKKFAIVPFFIELDKVMFMKIWIKALFRLEEYFLLYRKIEQENTLCEHIYSNCVFHHIFL